MNQVAAFKGIPYAAPPVGDLRWRAPQAALPWTDERDATKYGADCMQNVIADEAAPPGTIPAEDCLFVNVWKPASAVPGAKLPVLVWIHGGGYVNGGSSTPIFDGSAFARRGLVLVSLNYRLGRFGFFAHPALLAAKEGPVGNFGLMDQIAALQWVQREVAAFGGDPTEVTVMGESAGGASVLHLLTSPAIKGQGLFQRAVVLSGGGREALALRPMTGGAGNRPSADQVDEAFGQLIDPSLTGTSAETLKALRALPASEIAGQLTLPFLFEAALKGSKVNPGTPMIDGTIITGQPGDLLMQPGQDLVPLIIGTTAAELPIILPPAPDPFAYFGPDADSAKAAFNPSGVLDPFSAAISISSYLTMQEPARYAAKAVAAAGKSVWLYRFIYVMESSPRRSAGALHAQELPYLFDTLDARYRTGVTPKDRAMASQFNAYIATFATTGSPNADPLPIWPNFDPTRYELMQFTLDIGPVFTPDPVGQRIKLVEDAFARAQPK